MTYCHPKHKRSEGNGVQCDDQQAINHLYLWAGVEWLDLTETEQEVYHDHSSQNVSGYVYNYHKIGVVRGNFNISEDLWNEDMSPESVKEVHVPVQVMVLGMETALRSDTGLTKMNCNSTWVLNPIIPRRSYIKYKMFEWFDMCPIRV